MPFSDDECTLVSSLYLLHYETLSDTLAHLPSLGGTTVTLKYMNHHQDALQGHLDTYIIIKRHYSHTYVYLPSPDSTIVPLECMYLF